MNITLTGFTGTGKTTISRLLAQRLDRKLISTDEEVKKKIKLSIGKFVNMYGLEKFREVECAVIESISDFDECVFDTSSEVILRNENLINLKKNGLIILLIADIKTILSRIKNNKENLKSLLSEHEHRYKKSADYAIDTSNLSPEEVCDLVTHYVQMELQ